jgi:hypothetical protein
MASCYFAHFLSFFRYFRPGPEYDLDDYLRRELKKWAESCQTPEECREALLRKLKEAAPLDQDKGNQLFLHSYRLKMKKPKNSSREIPAE